MNSDRPSNLKSILVKVERVLPFGIFVLLPNGKRGYIRRRELDLDADAEPGEIVQEGQEIEALVIKSEQADTHVELSRRATLKDPWPRFALHYHEGDVLRGRVRALHPNGVFVRIEPGIDGFVPLAELANWSLSKPEELLWIGDDVEAIITQIRNRRLTLSIRARMQQHAKATSVIERLAEYKLELEGTSTTSTGEMVSITPEERDRIGQIYVIDDDEGIRNGLVEWLQQRGYYAQTIWPDDEILSRLPSDKHGVLIVDIHLSNSDGLELIRRINARGNRMHVCVMSSPNWLMDRSEDIRAAKVFQVFEKPLDKNEIARFLLGLAHGLSIQPAWKIIPRAKEGKAEAQILNLGLSETPPLHRLQTALAKLTEFAHAEKGVVFFNDPISQSISILAETGTLSLERKALYELKESPVNDIITENLAVVEAHATENKRFVKLLKLLRFESCIGSPIEVMGELHHALFFFHSRSDAFTRVRPQYIQLDAIWLSTILEQQALEQRLRTINPLLLSGELALSLAHEVYNKVESLELQVTNMLNTTTPTADLQNSLSVLQSSVLDLRGVVGSFQQMMRAKEIPTAFDINDVIFRAEMLLRPLARKEGIKIDLHLAESLPHITGNAIALQQVFFNIMLNSVQQMALKPDKHRLMEISTAYQPDEDHNFIKINFIDSGLGIHKQLKEKIFDLGFSTRGGSGLGLFIARSLIEMFDGKIQVEESTIPLGTTIQVNLPIEDRISNRS